jgi:hypothetical protein
LKFGPLTNVCGEHPSFTGLKFRYGLVGLAGKYRQFIDEDALIADCQRIGTCLGDFYFARWGHGSGNSLRGHCSPEVIK